MKINRLTSHRSLPRHCFKILTKCLSYCVWWAVFGPCLSLLFLWANGKGASSALSTWVEPLDIKQRSSWIVHASMDISRTTHLTITTLSWLSTSSIWLNIKNNEWLIIYSARHTKVGLCNYPQCKKNRIFTSADRKNIYMKVGLKMIMPMSSGTPEWIHHHLKIFYPTINILQIKYHTQTH